MKTSIWLIVAVVALRLAVGWHFYKEGVKKFQDPNFTSAGFLRPAKGPFAVYFMGMIPDPYGEKRLDEKRTVKEWENYRDDVIRRAGLEDLVHEIETDRAKRRAKAEAEEARKQGEKPKKTAEEIEKIVVTKADVARDIAAEYIRRYRLLLSENEEDIEQYLIGLHAWFKYKDDDSTSDLSYRRDWSAGKSLELRAKAGPWLGQIEDIREEYERKMAQLATGEEVPPRGAYPAPDPTAMPLIDNMVKWTVTLVGVGMLLGLFTRLWCVVGAGFLLSVIASQWPWAAGADTTYLYYQIVEIMAFGVLFVVDAGRHAGLDYFVYMGVSAMFGGKKQAPTPKEG